MPDQPVIFLFIDALGWEIVQANHFLEDLFPHRRCIEMQFGYSSAAIPTILSGKTPAVHKHLGLFRFSPEGSPFHFLGRIAPFLKPASLWNRGRVRHQLSRLLGRLCGFTGYFQLYQVPFDRLAWMDYCEKKDLFAPHGMGDVENLHDLLLRSGLKFHISDWHSSDSQNFAAARKALADGAQFLFLYTAELDGMLHQHPDPLAEPIREKLAWYAEEIRGVWKSARQNDLEPRFIVMSDHGMTPLGGTADIKGAVEETGLVFGRDYGVCYDSTMARFTFLKPDAEEKIRSALQPFGAQGHWLTEEEERHFGIFREDRWFGDAIFLMNPGIQIAPSDMGAKPLAGMHGFTPKDKDSCAALLSNVEIPAKIQRVADYFGWMQEEITSLR